MGAWLGRGTSSDGLTIQRHGADEATLLDRLIEDAHKLAR
jgi:hypothetical protein